MGHSEFAYAASAGSLGARVCGVGGLGGGYRPGPVPRRSRLGRVRRRALAEPPRAQAGAYCGGRAAPPWLLRSPDTYCSLVIMYYVSIQYMYRTRVHPKSRDILPLYLIFLADCVGFHEKLCWTRGPRLTT